MRQSKAAADKGKKKKKKKKKDKKEKKKSQRNSERERREWSGVEWRVGPWKKKRREREKTRN